MSNSDRKESVDKKFVKRKNNSKVTLEVVQSSYKDEQSKESDLQHPRRSEFGVSSSKAAISQPSQTNIDPSKLSDGKDVISPTTASAVRSDENVAQTAQSITQTPVEKVENKTDLIVPEVPLVESQPLNRDNDMQQVESKLLSTRIDFASTSEYSFKPISSIDISKHLLFNDEFSPVRNVVFSIVSNPQAYVGYSANVSQLYSSENTVTNVESIKSFYNPTSQTFRNGTQCVTLGYNEDLLDSRNIRHIGGVPVLSGMFFDDRTVRHITSTSNYLDDFGGKMALLVTVMADNRVAVTPKSVVVATHMLSQRQMSVIQSKIELEGRPHPMLCFFTSIPLFFSNYMSRMLAENQGIYTSGFVGVKEESNFGAKVVDIVATNIDQYTAAILNMNCNDLLQKTNVSDRYNAIARACALRNSIVNTPPDYDLNCYSFRDSGHTLRILMLAAIMFPPFENDILAINTEVVQSSGIVTMSVNGNWIPDSVSRAIDYPSIQPVFERYLLQSNDHNVHEMIAAQISPSFSVKRMVLPNDDFSDPNSFVCILALVIFAKIFPVSFNQIKGEVQNVLFRFLAKWEPEEYNIFIGTHGHQYTLVNGVPNFLPNSPQWDQENYLGNTYPSLFACHIAGVIFRRCPTITAMMMWFRPIGILVNDDRAVRAGFARIDRNPTHYIPIRPSLNAGPGGLTNSVNVVINAMRTNFIRYCTQQQYPAAKRSLFITYLTHVQSQLQNLEFSISNHWSIIWDSLANHELNFMNTFNGNFGTDKPIQYGVFGSSNEQMSLIKSSNMISSSQETINPLIIMSILSAASTPLMRRQGTGSIQVKISEDLLTPKVADIFHQHDDMIRKVNEMTRPYGIISLFMSHRVQTEFDLYEVRINDVPVVRYPRLKLILHQSYIQDILTYLNVSRTGNLPMVTLETVPNDLDEMMNEFNFLFINVPEGRLTVAMTNAIRASNPYISVLNDNFNVFTLLPDEELQLMLPRQQVDILQIRRQLNYAHVTNELNELRQLIPPMARHQQFVMDQVLRDLWGQQRSTFGHQVYEHITAQKHIPFMPDAQIRRVDVDGALLPYNPLTDNVAFRDSHSFLSERDFNRLEVGLSMISNQMLDCKRAGVRIFDKLLHYRSPNIIPDDVNHVVLFYDPLVTFVYMSHEGINILALRIVQNGVENLYATPDTYPSNIRLIINDRADFNQDHAYNIMAAVSKLNWIVDFPHDNFTYEVLYFQDEVKTSLNLDEYFKLAPGSCPHLYFYDDIMRPVQTLGTMPSNFQYRQLLYPLHQLQHNKSCDSIITLPNNQAPPGAIMPTFAECNTGEILPNGHPCYSNRASKLGQPFISMTNKVLCLNPINKIPDRLVFNVVAPKNLTTIAF